MSSGFLRATQQANEGVLIRECLKSLCAAGVTRSLKSQTKCPLSQPAGTYR